MFNVIGKIIVNNEFYEFNVIFFIIVVVIIYCVIRKYRFKKYDIKIIYFGIGDIRVK